MAFYLISTLRCAFLSLLRLLSAADHLDSEYSPVFWSLRILKKQQTTAKQLQKEQAERVLVQTKPLLMLKYSSAELRETPRLSPDRSPFTRYIAVITHLNLKQ